MTSVAFVAICAGLGAASLLVAANRQLSAAVGLIGLGLALLVATRIPAGETLRIGETAIAATDFTRLFLTLGALSGVLVASMAAATAWLPALPGVWLIVLAGIALALGFANPAVGVVAATVCGLVGIVVSVGPTVTEAGLGVGRRELRAVTLAGVVAVVAIGVVGRQSAIGLEPSIVGLAYLGLVAAVAVRLGSIPFHAWVARASDTAPPVALPLVMAWAPAAFVVVALGWTTAAIAPSGGPLTFERGLVVLVAALTVVLAAAAAAVNPDLEHVVAYSIVSDAAIALLGFTILDPSSGGPVRAWLLAFVLGKTAFAGWVAAIQHAFGARRLSELGGWARRSPLLGIALAGIALAAIGLPGMTVFSARMAIAGGSVAGPMGALLAALSFAPLLYYARLVSVGLSAPSTAVRSGASLLPRPTSRRRVASGTTIRDIAAIVGSGLRVNRAPIAVVLVLAMSGLAVAVAAGGLGAPSAAANGPASPAAAIGVESGAQ